MHQVDLEEAKDHLPELIDAAVKGEQIVITKDDQNRVKLVPLQNKKLRPLFGSGKGLITMADDFDEPLKDFEEYPDETLAQLELEDVMTAYKKYVTIKDPKSLVLTDLPFKQGQVVEVVVIAQDNGDSEKRVRDLQALLRETQALPQAQAISEDEIAAEMNLYRAAR